MRSDQPGYPGSETLRRYGRACDYLEEGTTTTPFDLLAGNRMTRHDLAADAVRQAHGWASAGGDLARGFEHRRDELLTASYRDGEDPAEITEWQWSR